jgi:hypothetical protein
VTAAERRQRRRAFDLLPPVEQQRIRDRLQHLLERQHWTTSRDGSHQWSERTSWQPHDEDFVFCVLTIRVLGYVHRHRKTDYVALDVGDHFYWTMGHPLNREDGRWCTRILNRKPLSAKPEVALPLFDCLT